MKKLNLLSMDEISDKNQERIMDEVDDLYKGKHVFVQQIFYFFIVLIMPMLATQLDQN